ncbi:transcriptional regulator [Paenibacillus darwinianus]|uniref:Transcriptional regulator n=1 Tax=Paenibacillus darwinianus TaxID=1380763 RepID=A0A9W5W7A0_9BACL|nr:LCP family protein [Paenibacillus darwinianus]EXX87498.1 transcriptional regulator [Paenibacillus darwinianus]EXX87544.1 transcriptional regulator [Paenibacillus darwinianus]EXX87635.1 transcriptional regulator [Paenibacillus darwinianus]
MNSKAARRKGPWKWALYGVVSIVAVILVYVAYQGIGIYNALNGFGKNDNSSRFKDVVDAAAEKPPEWEGRERVNILLLGADARGVEEGQVARSDSMLVASIDPVTKQAHLLSILRDTYADIPGYGKNRINTAITLGGPNLTMRAIGNLLDLDIQYYVYADFEGFKALVDAIGGVDYEVEKDMKYVDNADRNRYDIDLKKGYQRLDGDKALQYVRFRHDAMSDFTRTERQRKFMSAVAKKLQSTWNLVRMKTILDEVQPYIETNLRVSDMLKLGQLGLKVRVAGSAQVPPMDLLYEERSRLGAVLGIRDEDKLREYVREVLAINTTAPVPVNSADGGNDSSARGAAKNAGGGV